MSLPNQKFSKKHQGKPKSQIYRPWVDCRFSLLVGTFWQKMLLCCWGTVWGLLPASGMGTWKGFDELVSICRWSVTAVAAVRFSLFIWVIGIQPENSENQGACHLRGAFVSNCNCPQGTYIVEIIFLDCFSESQT